MKSGSIFRLPTPKSPFKDIKSLSSEALLESHVLLNSNEVFERYRLFFESARDIVLFIRPDGQIIDVNNAGLAAYGYNHKEFVSLKISDLRTPDTLATLPMHMQQALMGSVTFETIHRRKDGTVFPVEVYCRSGNVGGSPVLLSIIRDITEKKKAELSLRESEERYRTIVETTPECVKLVAKDGSLLSMNKAGLKMIGAAKIEDVLGASVFDLIDAKDRPRYEAFHQQVCAGNAGTLEFEIVGLNGVRRSMETHAVPWKDVSGQTYHLAITRDVTKRKQTTDRQSLIMEAGKILGSSLDHKSTLSAVCKLVIPHLADWCAIDLFTANGQIQHIEVAHRDPARIQYALEFRNKYPPVENKDGALMRVLRTGEPQLYPEITDAMLVKAAKTTEHLEMMRSLGFKSLIMVPLIAREQILGAMTLVTAESGYVYNQEDLELALELAARAALAVDNARLFSESRELTLKQKEMLERYSIMQQQLSLLVEASASLSASLELSAVLDAILKLSQRIIFADAYAIWRLNGTTSEWNIGHSNNLSEEYQKDVIKVLSETPSMPDKPVVAEDVNNLPILQERKAIYEKEGIHSLMAVPLKTCGEPNGTLVFYYRKPHKFSEDEISVAMALSNLAASAISTSDLYEELKQNDNKKDQFLAILAHELRNPLAPISNAIHLLKQPMLTEQVRDDTAALVHRQVEQMTHLLNDLLDISRITRGKIGLRLETMNLLDALNSAIEATKPLVIERRHDLETDFPDKPVHVHGDLTRLSQVFTNLLNNAAKYTDKGGELKVSVWTTDDKVYVTVRDNGIGIPGHMLEKIFDMFAQVDGSMERAYGGLGIGLTLVKNIVEMHKGSVTASSNGVGQGSEFLITLPLDKTVSEAPPLPANETSIQNADALRVLVVDDNEASAKTMGWALESFGHIATIAGDGWKALEIAKTFLPHAVLLDIGMPGMNGYEVCRKMREIPQLNHAIFIAQTGWGQKEHLERSKMAGFNFHLVKPVDFTKLQEILSLIGQENSGSAEPRG